LKAYPIGFNPSYSEANPTLEDVNKLCGYGFLEFGAPWCEHCVAAATPIEHVLTPLQLPHIKAYDGKGLPLGRAFKIKLWPTLVLLKDGVELARVVRPTSISDIKPLIDLIPS
jgi:thioredoxin 1